MLGEVKAIVFVDANRDGIRDMILGTKTGSGQGELHVLRGISRTALNRFTHQKRYNVGGEVTSMVATYVNGDTDPDLVIGTRISSVEGDIQYWQGGGSDDFGLKQTYTTNGPVLSLVTAAALGAALGRLGASRRAARSAPRA